MFPSLFFIRGEETRPYHEARTLIKVLLTSAGVDAACMRHEYALIRDDCFYSSWSLRHTAGGMWTPCHKIVRRPVSTGGRSASFVCVKLRPVFFCHLCLLLPPVTVGVLVQAALPSWRTLSATAGQRVLAAIDPALGPRNPSNSRCGACNGLLIQRPIACAMPMKTFSWRLIPFILLLRRATVHLRAGQLLHPQCSAPCPSRLRSELRNR